MSKRFFFLATSGVLFYATPAKTLRTAQHRPREKRYYICVAKPQPINEMFEVPQI
jgi:hypothetical protein